MKNKYLYLSVLIALLPVLLLRDFTPDNELRYLSIADEALQNGSWFTFTNHGAIYADKPPLYLWIVMFGKWLFGGHFMLFLSLFSVIPAFVIVQVMDEWMATSLSGSHRMTGRLLLLSCALFLGLGIVLRMDMLMCMFIVLALRSFYRLSTDTAHATRHEQWLFPIYVFLALFTKGPVGILVPLLVSVVWLSIKRRLRSFWHYWGWITWGVLLSGCACWFAGVWLEGGSDYLNNLLVHQTVDRAVNSFHHEEPFYYYFISVWYSLAPWSLLLMGVIAVSLYRRLIHTDIQRFFLVTLLTTFVMLSCISSKIAVYLAPAFPFFVWLAVSLFQHFQWNHWIAFSIAVPSVVYVLSAPLLWWMTRMESANWLGQGLFYVAAMSLSVTGVWALYQLYVRRQWEKAVSTLVVGLFCAVFVGGWALSSVNAWIGYRAMCAKAVELKTSRGLSEYCVWKVRRAENSDVYLHEPVREVQSEELLSGNLENVVLMLPLKWWERDEAVRSALDNKERYTIGKHIVVVL